MGAQEAKYKMMFKMLDSDKSGHIDKNDFNKGLMKMVPQNQRDTIIKTLDKNGDGKVDYKEFKKTHENGRWWQEEKAILLSFGYRGENNTHDSIEMQPQCLH